VATLVFSGGDVTEPLVTRKSGEGDRKQGTTVRAWPDGKYFESSALPMNELTHLLRSKAVLMPGVTVTLVNEKTKETQQWQYKAGLRDYLTQTLNGDPVIPLFEGEGFADANHDSFAEGEGASWAVAFTEDGAPVRESYVNLIPTSAGGTHDSGLRDGLFTASESNGFHGEVFGFHRLVAVDGLAEGEGDAVLGEKETRDPVDRRIVGERHEAFVPTSEKRARGDLCGGVDGLRRKTAQENGSLPEPAGFFRHDLDEMTRDGTDEEELAESPLFKKDRLIGSVAFRQFRRNDERGQGERHGRRRGRWLIRSRGGQLGEGEEIAVGVVGHGETRGEKPVAAEGESFDR
jgi:hypothetical protein